MKGTDVGLDRSQALMVSQSYISEEGPHYFFYPINTIPGADRSKVRGEQRFTAWSLPDAIAPESQLWNVGQLPDMQQDSDLPEALSKFQPFLPGVGTHTR